MSNGNLVKSFVSGGRTGHSNRYHIEEHTLLEERFVTVAIRCGVAGLLIRTDTRTERLQARVRRHGFTRLETDPPLAVVVGLQAAGLPAASWDLWGTDLEGARAALGRAAAGGLEVSDPGLR